jgi:hypothetical protein
MSAYGMDDLNAAEKISTEFGIKIFSLQGSMLPASGWKPLFQSIKFSSN